MKDYYAVLGVARDASQEEIKRRFRKLARETHPDANPDDPEAEERFREIAEAYEVLSDPERRARYDRGEAFDAGDLFTQFAGLDEILQQFFGSGFGFDFGFGRARSRPRQGRDVVTSLELTLAEAAFGVSKELAFRTEARCGRCGGLGAEPDSKVVTCSACRGRGQVQVARNTLLGTVMTVTGCGACGGRGQVISTPCRECRGVGIVEETRTVTVEVPGGVEDGTRLRLSGRGGAGERGAPAGDLYVELKVAEDPRFRREGDDLHHRVTVGITEAILGTTIEVPTIDGESTTIDLEAGTQPGTVLRVPKRGVPHLRRRGRGDLYVHVGVEIPTDLDAEEEELIRRLAELRGERPAQRRRGLFRR
ncbi:MAG TPA: molecular chaperone DnaJ [Actinobacteria bacterium]|nr:molecular chaperone DnaJ [Actinomycetota bacterium]